MWPLLAAPPEAQIRDELERLFLNVLGPEGRDEEELDLETRGPRRAATSRATSMPILAG